MNPKTEIRSLDPRFPLDSRCASKGFSLIELMISITLGLLIMAALTVVLVNVSRNNKEMATTNSQIENGRFAIQILQNDIVHAGFWGGFNPRYDDLTSTTIPADVPTAIPDPCLTYSASNWNTAYRNNLIGIPVQSNDAAPGTCASVVTNQKANTDVLVIRHAETCEPGVGNCPAAVSGKLYFQASSCTASTITATANSITLAANSSSTNDHYKDLSIYITGGTGAGQMRTINAYDGTTKTATVSSTWVTIPDTSSRYAFDYVLNTLALPDATPSKFPLFAMSCATQASKRKFVSSIYYVRDFATTAGDGIPTLVRSSFDPNGTAAALAHQAADPLIEGIEGFRVEFGIDSLSKTGFDIVTNATLAYSQAVQWADIYNKVTPINRGNGSADGDFVSCSTATPCTAAQMMNAVVVKIHVLSRSLQTTLGYTNSKTFCLGTPDTDGSCPAANTFGPYNDGYQRHVYSSTVRLNNISGRRETPP